MKLFCGLSFVAYTVFSFSICNAQTVQNTPPSCPLVATSCTFTGNILITPNTATLPASFTNTPLRIAGGDAASVRLLMDGFGGTPIYTSRRAEGTAAIPTAVQLNSNLGGHQFYGYGATAYSSTSRAQWNVFAAENWTDSAQGTYHTWSTSSIGAAVNAERVRLSAAGNFLIGRTTDDTVSRLQVGLSDAAWPAALTGTVTRFANASGTSSVSLIEAAGASVTPTIAGRRSGGTFTSPTAIPINGVGLGLEMWGYGASAYSSAARAFINHTASEAWTDSAQGTYIAFSTTITGGTSTAERMRIAGTSGGLLIGTTTDDGTSKLQVTGNATVSGTLTVGGTSILPILVGATGTITPGALLAGACGSGTASITGATTAMGVVATPVTYPGDGSYWLAYVSSSNTVTVKVCVAVAGTPGATAYNVRVVQ